MRGDNKPQTAMFSYVTLEQRIAGSISQRKRKRIERVFGWSKLDRPLRQVKRRGLPRVDWFYRLTIAAYNLVRMRSLIPVEPAAA